MPGRAGLTVSDTGHMTDSKQHFLPVPRCLVFLPLRAAYTATHLGLLVGSKGEQAATGGVGIQRCLPELPGESTGLRVVSELQPAFAGSTPAHTKPQNYKTLCPKHNSRYVYAQKAEGRGWQTVLLPFDVISPYCHGFCV